MESLLFGVETEYAVAATAVSARRDPIESFMTLTRERLAHLPCLSESGIFLENGGRLYLDRTHPEFATPECTDPGDLVRYVLAGDEILRQTAVEWERLNPGSKIVLFKGSVDYYSPATWACHASFHFHGNPTRLAKRLIPFLVTRVIFTGAGGFDPMHPGLQFSLSPRVSFLEREISEGSTEQRGIFHTRDEPLSASGKRLHVICGESVCSQTSLWLMMATTALVTACLSAGNRPPLLLDLQDSLGAMRSIARDPHCQAHFRLADGSETRALDIQRRYLNLVRNSQKSLPDWANTACALWEDILDKIEQGGLGVCANQLDWAIKLQLYEQRLRHRQIDWSDLPRWNNLLVTLDRAVRTKRAPIAPARSSREQILDIAKASTPILTTAGVTVDQLDHFLTVRDEMFEVDIRFAQLHEPGIFAALDHGGLLQHQAPGVGSFENAIRHPPVNSRAHLRGDCVKRLHTQRQYISCGWTEIWDAHAGKRLDLSNPFECDERWVDLPVDQMEPLLNDRARVLVWNLRRRRGG